MVWKAFFSFQNNKKSFFLAFFAQKKNKWEKGRFFDKNHGLTPLQNVDYLEFFRTYLLWSKKHSFLSRILKNVSFWLSLLKKNIWEKGRFFEKNHGLTPWQNVHFFDFFRTSLFRSKKHSFLSRISKNASFWFFFGQKKKYEKKFNFWQKPLTNPFAKCRFFSTLWQLHFWGPKSFIFYPENQKMLLSGFFRLKKTYKKKVDFLTKIVD